MESRVDSFLKKKQVDSDKWDAIKKSFVIKYEKKHKYNGGDYDEYILNLWDKWHTYVDFIIKNKVVKGFADGKRDKFIKSTSIEYVEVFEFAMPILKSIDKVKEVIDDFYRLTTDGVGVPNKKIAAKAAVNRWDEFKYFTLNSNQKNCNTMSV